MQCAICHKTLNLFDPNKVSITMEPDNDNRYLHRVFNVCEKCAYGFIEQFYKADPMCAKCDADENQNCLENLGKKQAYYLKEHKESNNDWQGRVLNKN